MKSSSEIYNLAIIGGGPAGLAPLLAAHTDGRLAALLSQGVAIVEQSEAIGGGQIGHYGINSDSSGKTFADCLDGPHESELTRLAAHPLARQMVAAGDGPVPLADAGRFLGLVGAALTRMIEASPASCVLTRHRALSAQRFPEFWRVTLMDMDFGTERVICARNLVLATGAEQPVTRLADERICGARLVDLAGGRLIQSGDVLLAGGLQRVAARLAGKAAPRVAIVGGSTSAAAVADALLNRMPRVTFAEGGVTLMHRRPLRIFYMDRAAALAEGYTEWTEDDICPISGRVFRFAGFRLNSRELIMQARGIGGRAPEPRLRLHQLPAGEDPVTQEILRGADLVVAALGYRPRALPLFAQDGEPIELLARTGPQMAMVDGQCRVMDQHGLPVEGVYGIGLAAGFVPRGALGGEPSFRGQANGLWLWQHDVGALIVEAVLGVLPLVVEPANSNIPALDFPAEAAAAVGD